MRQQQFEAQHGALWEEFAQLVAAAEKREKSPQLERLPELYRRVCSHYALARHRHYSTGLLERLHALVLLGHRVLYRQKSVWLWRIVVFFWAGFPSTLRRHRGVFWLASGLFWLPALAMGLACYFDGDFLHTVLDAPSVTRMEYMYDPSNPMVGRAENRESATDFAMLGYYIWNNVGIGFRTFASGMLFGLGTVFVLLFNGTVIGGVAGHLTQLGFTQTFWPFVSGHSAFELTAICISGTAGLLLAQALLAPGQQRRVDALQGAAKEAVKLMIGAAALLILAAFIEAFWSSTRSVAPVVKYGVGAALWVFLSLYLGLAGRRRGN